MKIPLDMTEPMVRESREVIWGMVEGANRASILGFDFCAVLRSIDRRPGRAAMAIHLSHVGWPDRVVIDLDGVRTTFGLVHTDISGS